MSARNRLSTAGLLLAMLATAPAFARDDPLSGRLFYSVQERQALDALLRGEVTSPVAGPVEVAPSELRFNGFVHRSRGESTAWVDGAPLDRSSSARANALQLRGETLRIERGNGPVDLRAGQRIAADGTRVDGTRLDPDGHVVPADAAAASNASQATATLRTTSSSERAEMSNERIDRSSEREGVR